MTGRLANSIYDLRYTSLRAGIQYNQEFTSYSGQITKYSAFVFSQNGKFQRLRQYKRRCYYIASKFTSVIKLLSLGINCQWSKMVVQKMKDYLVNLT